MIAVIASCNTGGNVFRAAMTFYPAVLDPLDANANYKLYILKQLHEPLFYKKTKYTYGSNILKEWSVSNDFKRFSFCVREGVKFSNEKEVTASDVIANLQRAFERRVLTNGIHKKAISGRCVIIEYQNPYHSLLGELSSYEAAIADPETFNSRVVIGISPYHVESFDEQSIVLKSNDNVRYRTVIFEKWSPGLGKPLHDYDDITFVAQDNKDVNLSDKMNAYNVLIMKNYIILLNTPDIEARKVFYNCADVDKLRTLFFPRKEVYRDVGGVLPVGISGAIGGRIEQVCPARKYEGKTEITLITLYADKIRELKQYFDKFSRTTGLSVTVKHVDMYEFEKHLRSPEKNYGSVLLGVDAVLSDPMYIFNMFMRDNNATCTTIENDRYEAIIAAAMREMDVDKKETLFRSANKALLDNYQLIPLFQVESEILISKRIKNISSDDLMLGYIDIKNIQ